MKKKELLILGAILLIGAFLRFYKISEYLTFLGDEGRDVVVVRRFLVNGDLMFVGPGTSVGNMYLGPIYYYMIAPFLWAFNYSPVGPAIFVAILGVATIYFVWRVSGLWFGKTTAIISALLYAVSPVVVSLSRTSWNPNIMPFFALLTIYSIWKVYEQKKWGWIIITSLSFGIVTQSHYLGLLLLPVIVIFWFLSKPISIRYTLYALILFAILSSPLFIFDAKYDWRNFKAFDHYLFSATGDIKFQLTELPSKLWGTYELVITRLLAGTDIFWGKVFSIVLLLFLMGVIFLKRRLLSKAHYLLIVWFFIGIFGLSLYKGAIYDHYFGFLFPAPYLLLGLVVENIDEKNKLGKILIGILTFLLIMISLRKTPLKNSPNRQLQRSMAISQKIVEEAKGKKFNFAVIAEKNYEGAYEYFFESWGSPLSKIDPQRYEETVSEQLFVVCEYEDREKCQPTSNPKAEVANFGWSKIDKEWEVWGIKVFKLVHNISN